MWNRKSSRLSDSSKRSASSLPGLEHRSSQSSQLSIDDVCVEKFFTFVIRKLRQGFLDEAVQGKLGRLLRSDSLGGFLAEICNSPIHVHDMGHFKYAIVTYYAVNVTRMHMCKSSIVNALAWVRASVLCKCHCKNLEMLLKLLGSKYGKKWTWSIRPANDIDLSYFK